MLLFVIKFFAFALGCMGCLEVRSLFGFSSVSASACVGLVATALPSFGGIDRRRIHAVAYAGTFAGMGSLELLHQPLLLLTLSIVGAAVYWLLRPVFVGVGGKLGTVAFVTSLLLFIGRSLG